MPRVRTAAVGVKICKNLPRETTEVENPVLISVPPNAVVLLLMLSVVLLLMLSVLMRSRVHL